MGYIDDLRHLIGNRPLIMAGAAVLAFDSTSRLLLLRRTDNGCWGLPGGAMEPGESLEHTARRETFEELGLTVGELSLFGVFSGPECFYRYPNGAEVYNVTAVYITRGARGEANIDLSEHSEMGYFDPDQLPTLISPPLKPILDRFVLQYSETH